MKPDEFPTDSALTSYDWVEALAVSDAWDPAHGVRLSTIIHEDVVAVDAFWYSGGGGGDTSVLALLQLTDERYALLEAGCDYTGWEIGSGTIYVGTKEEIYSAVVTVDQLEQMKVHRWSA